MKKLLSILIIGAMAVSSLVACVPKSESASNGTETETVSTDSDAATPVTLEYWTWFPSTDQFKETITNFEKENQNIKINLTVMESKNFQEKVPLALASEDDIDLIGVQPTAFATEIADYLSDLDPLLQKVAGEDWASAYSESTVEKAKKLTGDSLKFLAMVNSGSMIGYYNAELLQELGMEVPTTIEEYKQAAQALKEKYPDKYAGIFGGKEAWIMDEMMLTVLGQHGDYYNNWRYENASVDSPEYRNAFNGLKRFFDEGIFSLDVLDLDGGRAAEVFAAGDALVWYMGSWEAPILSSVLREQKGIDLADVGVMALPVVEEGGKASVRAYLDAGIGIVNYSEKQEAAAKFVAYCTVGDGVETLAKQFMGTPGKKDFVMDESMLTTETAKAGWEKLVELMNNATVDRNNVSGYSDIEGASVQKVILGTSTAEQEVTALQAEWTSGKYQ